MPEGDRGTVDDAFLRAHAAAAEQAWKSAPWAAQVDEALFLDAILPYASVSEKRELWITPLRELCLPMVAGAKTPGEAAVMLNQKLFPAVKVKYSTKRRRADQSPSESMESGLASCTGLSILLVDACRSVGIPARFVGTPMWTDNSGNHSWVEVWDGTRWRFTGAAEPAGDRLDDAWFTQRASTADRTNPDHAIYAVTWRDTGVEFPMVFDPSRPRARAVDVTDRYAGKAPAVPDGSRLTRVCVRSADGQRVAAAVQACDAAGTVLATGTSKDERFDLNDHLELVVPAAATVSWRIAGTPVTAACGLSGVVELSAPAGAAASAAASAAAPDATSATKAAAALPATLAKSDVARARTALWNAYAASARAEARADLNAKVIEAAGARMPIWWATYGDKPKGGRSLFISMHGGGGAPKQVNDQQWDNQKRLYKPAEGVYVAPRAPGDTWDLWHQGHVDPLFARLIRDMVLLQDVNPDRVYIMGYSAGGDGVYQLAPRMADRFAAAAMMAGHPNETKPDGLRNLPFTLHMGGNDGAFKRNEIGRQWGTMLDALSKQDPGGYPHEVVIHEGKGHWMDREDAVAVPWMAKHVRNLRPERIVWLQDDVTEPRFYWLRNPAPKGGQRVVATRAGQAITIEEATGGIDELGILLDDEIVDLDKPVRVTMNGATLFEGVVPRTTATLKTTIEERGDPRAGFPAEVRVSLPAGVR
jgi:predicted esterase